MMKWLIGIVIVLLVIGGGGAAVVIKSPLGEQLMGGGGDGKAVGTPVLLAEPEQGLLIRTVSAPGAIEPSTLVQISSQVSAKVIEAPFEEGESVRAGDVVVRLDPQDLTARLESAQASKRSEEARLKGAQASLINARLEYERLESLYETGDVTKSELDGAEAAKLSAESSKQVIEHSIEIATATIEQAQKDLDNTVISAPMDGVITAMNIEVGETVIVGTTNNPGSVIMEIADLSRMLLTAQVDETNIAPVEIGQPATIYINAFPGREFRGVVDRIGLKRQVTSDGTGVFNIEILLDDTEDQPLFSGLTASTDIEVERFEGALRVPSQAVLDRRVDELPLDIRAHELVDQSKTFARVVYRMIEGKAKATPVRVGASDLTHTIIESGLEAGERVVVGPYRELVTLSHDQAIRDEEAEAEKAAEEEAASEEGAAENGTPDDSEGDTDSNTDTETESDADETSEGAEEEAAASAGGDAP